MHVDVDVLDFTDAPLAENTDGRNSGPSLEQLREVLGLAARDSRFRALSIGELNPTRAAGEPEAILRFVSVLATTLGAMDGLAGAVLGNRQFDGGREARRARTVRGRCGAH